MTPPPESPRPSVPADRPETALERLTRKRLDSLEDAVGHSPDPYASPPDLGSGMRRVLAEIRIDLAEIKTLVSGGSRFFRWSGALFIGALIVLLAGTLWRLGDRVRLVDGEPARRALNER